jgi:hypothetical protein
MSAEATTKLTSAAAASSGTIRVDEHHGEPGQDEENIDAEGPEALDVDADVGEKMKRRDAERGEAAQEIEAVVTVAGARQRHGSAIFHGSLSDRKPLRRLPRRVPVSSRLNSPTMPGVSTSGPAASSAEAKLR